MKNQIALALIAATGLSTLLATTANASPWFARNINGRQWHQQYRISQGIQNGTLNPREVARLEAREAHVNRLEQRLRVGGLSPSERARLQHELNGLNHSIYNQKHDCQNR